MQTSDRHRFGLVFALLLGSLWALPGLALESPPSNPPPLNEKELLPYKLKGHGSLAGQAFLSSPSGKAITQAGVPVHLIPMTSYTRFWFERSVRASACPSKSETATNCTHEAIPQLLTDKRIAPYLRTTRANPTGHFWFTKLPAGRYYIVSVMEGGAGSHQEERAAGIAWLIVDLDSGEKATNLVVTDCNSGPC